MVLDALRGAREGRVEPGLASGVVFSWAFLELIIWFWVGIPVGKENKGSAYESG